MSNTCHDYEQVVHLADNDDAEDIELVGGSLRRRHDLPPPLPSCPALFDRILLLFLIALIVGYKLGMEEGKAEVQHDWMNGAMIESNSKELQDQEMRPSTVWRWNCSKLLITRIQHRRYRMRPRHLKQPPPQLPVPVRNREVSTN